MCVAGVPVIVPYSADVAVPIAKRLGPYREMLPCKGIRRPFGGSPASSSSCLPPAVSCRSYRPAPPSSRGRTLRLVTRAAMFDNLSRSMEKAWKLVSKDGKLSPENVKEPLKEIRRALLEADVSLPVVRRFMKRVEEKAVGQQVCACSTP